MTSRDQPEREIDLTTSSAALDSARSRREALGLAADLIEDLAARPGSDPRWTLRVADSLQGLKHAFHAHVDEVEDDDGLLPQVQHDAPRLARGVQRMYREHVEINEQLDAAIALVRSCAGDCGPEQVESIREAVVDLLRWISRHRQRGADLVYEAYHVDIGGG